MEAIRGYFLTNFFLICLAFGVIFMVTRSNRSRKSQIIMPILIVCSALLLSIAYAVEQYCLDKPDLVFVATFCFFFGFALRPLVLYFFMRLSVKNKLILRIALILIAVNAVVYSLTLFIDVPEISHLVYWYSVKDGMLEHNRGIPLYYFSYLVVGVMMVYFIIFSLKSLTGWHRYDALASLICVVFIGLAVLLETVLYEGTLLNTTVAIACLFYVVHLYQQAANRDGLTGLYDRKTYYADATHLGSRIVGVVMVDMNCLKYINDNQGHQQGDIAINTVAQVLLKAVDRRYMYVYRLGGDEFLITSTATKEGSVASVVVKIRELLSSTPYSASMGLAIRENPEQSVDELFTVAEKAMYVDKAKFYKESGIERRKGVPDE